MDLEFTADQEELRRSAQSFLDGECPITLVREVVESDGSDDPGPAGKLWESMVALDWPALSISEDYGGIGLGFVDVAVVLEELGARIAPGPYLSTVTQFVPAVRETGADDQRRKFLGAVAGGELTGGFAFADHPARWGVEDLTSTAERALDGWRLQGLKQAVLLEHGADEVVVAARVGKGVGLFVVPVAAVSVRPVHSLDASRRLATVNLDGAHVSGDRALGEPGSPELAMLVSRSVDEATTALTVELVGTCQTLFDITLQHTKDRHQFGSPIGSFQAVKHKMSDCFVALQRARSLAYLAVAAIDEDDPVRELVVPMAKAAADDCQRLICQESIQTLGGIGFTWEHDAHLYVKRAKASGAIFGGAAYHRRRIARTLGISKPG